MKALDTEHISHISGGNPLAWAVGGYVGGKAADVVVRQVKEDIQESRERSRKSRVGKEKKLTRRGWRWG